MRKNRSARALGSRPQYQGKTGLAARLGRAVVAVALAVGMAPTLAFADSLTAQANGATAQTSGLAAQAENPMPADLQGAPRPVIFAVDSMGEAVGLNNLDGPIIYKFPAGQDLSDVVLDVYTNSGNAIGSDKFESYAGDSETIQDYLSQNGDEGSLKGRLDYIASSATITPSTGYWLDFTFKADYPDIPGFARSFTFDEMPSNSSNNDRATELERYSEGGEPDHITFMPAKSELSLNTPGTYRIVLSLTFVQRSPSGGASAWSETARQDVEMWALGTDIKDQDLPVAYAGASYSYTVEPQACPVVNEEGASTLSWALENAPAWLSISEDGTISGTVPSDAPATVPVTVKVENSAAELDEYADSSKTASKTFTLSITQPTAIAAPSAAKGLTYTGESQTGVTAGEGYTVEEGAAAVDAGTYTATVALQDGYVWDEATVSAYKLKSSADALSVPWSIAPAEVAAPVAADGLVYTGAELTGVTAGEGYTVEGGTATETGSYTATAKVDANHAWNAATVEAYKLESNTADLSIPWSITPSEAQLAVAAAEKAADNAKQKAEAAQVAAKDAADAADKAEKSGTVADAAAAQKAAADAADAAKVAQDAAKAAQDAATAAKAAAETAGDGASAEKAAAALSAADNAATAASTAANDASAAARRADTAKQKAEAAQQAAQQPRAQQAAGKITVKALAAKKAIKVKASKKNTIAAKKYAKVTQKTGAVSYKLSKVPAKLKKKASINPKTGKITIKKGAKKGTYTLTVTLTSAQSTSYKAANKAIKVKVKVA